MYAGTAYAGTFSAADNCTRVSSIEDMTQGGLAKVRNITIIIGQLVETPDYGAWINGSQRYEPGLS